MSTEKNTEREREIANTGWIAWHPRMGAAFATASQASGCCMDRLLKLHYDLDSRDYEFDDDYYLARDHFMIDAEESGWRIRPVKLVFLDEEGEK